MGVRERAAMIVGGPGSSSLAAGGARAAAAAAAGPETERTEKGSEDVTLAGDRRTRVMRAVERLIERGGGGMGRVYKVMAIVPEAGGRRRPVGFGGGVEGEDEANIRR
jgi:hypothetical protein